MKKIFAIILSFAMLLPALPATAGTVNDAVLTADEEAIIAVSSNREKAGKTVDITVSLEDNPGIISMLLKVNYDNTYLTLTEVKDAGVLGEQVHSDNILKNPYTLSWANDTAEENYTANGKIVTLTFAIADDAPVGKYPVDISYDNENYDILNYDLEAVDFAVSNGVIEVIDYICGDVNDDGKVNSMDRIHLARHLSDWDGFENINEKAADINEDGKVNSMDRIYLARHLSDWDGFEVIPIK